MVIDPSLGIRPANLAPLEANQQQMITGLQQLGLQLRNDLQTIQTNRQLQTFGQDLQGINPQSDDFAPKIVNAISRNPLAAHSPAGVAIINQLGDAHKAYIQSTLLAQKLGNGALPPGPLHADPNDPNSPIVAIVSGAGKVSSYKAPSQGANPYRIVTDKFGNPTGRFNQKTGQVESLPADFGLPAPGDGGAEGDLTAQPKEHDKIMVPDGKGGTMVGGEYIVGSKGQLVPSYYPKTSSDGTAASKWGVYMAAQDAYSKKVQAAAAARAEADTAYFGKDEKNSKAKALEDDAASAKRELDSMKKALGIDTDQIPGIPPPTASAAPAATATAAPAPSAPGTRRMTIDPATGQLVPSQ